MAKTIKIIIGSVLIILAAIIFYAVIGSFFWQEAYALIKALSWTTIVIFVAWILTISFIKAIRFFIILKSGEVQAPFIKTVMLFISSQVFTLFPGGEIGRAVLFKNKLHLEMEQVATPVYLQAVVELWTAVFLAMASVFFVTTGFGVWFGIGLLVMLAILSVSILAPKRLSNLLKFFKSKGLKYKWLDKFGQTLDASGQFVVSQDGVWRWRLWLKLIALGAISHLLAGGLIWYIAQLQGVNLSFFQSIFAATIAVLIQGVLGIIPGGLGVTEGGLIGVLTAFGLAWDKAVIVTLTYRVLTLPLLIVIALLFLFFTYLPNIFRKKAPNKF